MKNGLVEVLLISPPFKGLLREPVGLYYLAGVLNTRKISTAIMDFNIQLPTRTGFRDNLRHLKPKIVGVTSFTFNFSAAQAIVSEIKSVDQRIVTVMGGVHASALPEEVLKSTHDLDFIVVGEGEYTFLELCEKVLDREPVEHITGLAFKREGGVTINPPRGVIENLDDLPFPDRELLPFKKYPLALVQTSRGCPYECIFCHINRFYGRRTRLRNASRVVDECENINRRYGTEKFFFFGDSFTFNSDWVEDFCDEISRRGLKIVWGCETRVDNVSPSMLRKMRQAGCIEIQYGIDYGDEEVLRNLGKDIPLNCIGDAVKWSKEADLFTGAFFIFNVPGEDETTMESTFDLIQRVPMDAIEVNLLTPYPGTPLWSNPERYDMKIVDYDFDYYTTKKYVMENRHFPKNRFVPAFRRILKRLNFVPTPQYYPEIFDFIKRNIKLRVWEDLRI